MKNICNEARFSIEIEMTFLIASLMALPIRFGIYRVTPYNYPDIQAEFDKIIC